MRTSLALFAAAVFLVLSAATGWASLEANVAAGFRQVAASRWGLATLVDAYAGFTWFWLWIAYRERTWGRRLLWLVLVYALGNLAMAAYVVIQLADLRPGDGPDALLLRRPA